MRAVVGQVGVAVGLALREVHATLVVGEREAEGVAGADLQRHQAPPLRSSLVTRTSRISSKPQVAV